MNYLAQIKLYDPDKGFLKGFGKLGLETASPTEGISIFTQFVSSVIGLMTIIAIIWFVFKFISGAIGIISSGGDKASLENARKNITTGIIGLVVVIAALFVIDLVGALIGIPDILNLEVLFSRLPFGQR